MSSRSRVAAFASALLIAFAGAYLVGAALPAGRVATASTETGASAPDGTGGGHASHAMADPISGLSVADAGYLLEPEARILPAGQATSFRFRVLGPDGKPARSFEVRHEKRLHLIVVRRDFTMYQHLHPTMAADGTWVIDLTLPEPGTYRMFADFVPTGLTDRASLVLGADLFAPGDTTIADVPRPSTVSQAGGVQVAISGEPSPGKPATFTFAFSRGGQPVTDLQPFLGAFGHLVAMRQGDLAYLHVHPAENAPPGDAGRTAGAVLRDAAHRGAVRVLPGLRPQRQGLRRSVRRGLSVPVAR